MLNVAVNNRAEVTFCSTCSSLFRLWRKRIYQICVILKLTLQYCKYGSIFIQQRVQYCSLHDGRTFSQHNDDIFIGTKGADGVKVYLRVSKLYCTTVIVASLTDLFASRDSFPPEMVTISTRKHVS